MAPSTRQRGAAPARDARPRHRSALVDQPIGDQEQDREGEEDLVAILRTHAAFDCGAVGVSIARSASVRLLAEASPS